MGANLSPFMFRVYLHPASLAIKSSKRCGYYLSYLKLRTIAKNKGGRFYLKDAVQVLGLSERTTKKHLNMIPEVVKTANGYKLQFSKDLEKNKKYTFVLISKEKLMSFNWKNIGEFHAYLSELEIERYKRHQRALTKGYTKFNHKDKCIEKIKDGKKGRFHDLQSVQCSALLLNKGTATISRYKKKQKVATYEYKVVTKFDSKYFKNDEFDYSLYLKDFKGQFLQSSSGYIYFSPISKRLSSLKIKMNS